jgi:cellobiose phosphorylase
MYQLVLESFVGLKKEGDAISFSPCLPAEWPSIKVKYRYNGQVYDFEILQ